MVECEEEADDIEEISSETKDETEDTSTYEIFSYGADYTLSVLYEKMNNDEIITPGFQRRYVWKKGQASRLIESFLLGLPVPGIFLTREQKSGNFIVIDGQQRLVTCKAFRDKIFPLTSDPFKLTDVKEKWLDKTYDELDSADRKRFNDSILRATIIQQQKPNDNTSVYHIFQRLNTGGTPLYNQEIRNSLYYGPLNNLLKQLNEHETWRDLFGIPRQNPRMKDEELILRFFALYFNYHKYKKPMNEFISKFMEEYRDPGKEELKQMEELFIKTITLINDKIGKQAFRPKGSINTAAYDSVMYIVATYFESLRDDLRMQIRSLFHDSKYTDTISLATTDEQTVQKRMEITKQYLVKQ